jgi:hypothetical protein
MNNSSDNGNGSYYGLVRLAASNPYGVEGTDTYSNISNTSRLAESENIATSTGGTGTANITSAATNSSTTAVNSSDNAASTQKIVTFSIDSDDEYDDNGRSCKMSLYLYVHIYM